MLPNFLIIGAPRAGTTWLAKNLREHPQIFMPKTKEIHFFDRHYEEGIEYYERFFATASGYSVLGEATPEYMYLPQMPALIHKWIPDCKLILVLRNPVDRVYSRYWNARVKYKENRKLSFEEKIKQKPLFLEEGYYYEHLKRYYKYFNVNQFLILNFDDIQYQPFNLLNNAFEFLNVDANLNTGKVQDRINSAADKPGLVKSRLVYYAQKLAGRLQLKQLSQSLMEINTGSYPKMKPETRKWLVEEVYREQNIKLQELTGLDVSNWQ